ncbi:MAG: symmetrical bis(5'-nucleosyl)-tetraphosphatase [Myxococcales bacterium]|nr:symmetrical bis(5'-nucleosyl)-tetraphosphatase [Myxococcales bacterium]
MSTYVVGDIQGCHAALERLLEKLSFSPTEDRLWLCGDLVNRGPDNVSVLRFARAIGASVVLGNHDLHLLAAALVGRPLRPKDTVQDVLLAPDRDELIDWLRQQPFVLREGDVAMVHAGFLPSWTWSDVEERSSLAARAFAQDPKAVLELLQPGRLSGDDEVHRAAKAITVFTRIRMVDRDERLDAQYAGPPESAAPHLVPWYASSRLEPELTVCFGHWASLGYRHLGRFLALDSGCVWGQELTALRLDDFQVFQVPARDHGG